MTAWTSEELKKVDSAEESPIASLHKDGSLRSMRKFIGVAFRINESNLKFEPVGRK